MRKKERGIGPETERYFLKEGKKIQCPHCGQEARVVRISTEGKRGTIFREFACSNCNKVLGFNGISSNPKEAS